MTLLVCLSACSAIGGAVLPQRGDFIAADGARLSYRSYGQGHPVIVLAGGPGMDADYIAPVAQGAAADGFRAILPDLRGTGRSTTAGRGLLTVAGSVSDIESLREAIGAEQVSLIGHSFGGALAQAYATAFPTRVARLVLLGSVGADLSPSPDAAVSDSWMPRLTADEQARYSRARAEGDAVTAIRLKFLGSFVDRKKGEAFVAELGPGFAHSEVTTPMSTDFRINYKANPTGTHPVTIVYGEADWIRAWQPSLTRAYSSARVILIPHSGHFPWAEMPTQTASALRSALSD